MRIALTRRGRVAGLLLAATYAGPAFAFTAYVTNERDNTISVVDLDQMKTVKTVAVGQRPRGIAMTMDGSMLLVCASDDDTIQIIDVTRCASSATCRPARIPRRLPCMHRAIRSMCRTRTTTW